MTVSPRTTRSEVRWLIYSWIALVLFAGGPLFYYLYYATAGCSFNQVVPERIFRSGKPSPEQLESWIQEYNIRTVVSLCVRDPESTRRIAKLLHRSDVKHISIPLSAYTIATPEQLSRLIEVLDTAERPILIHCRQGIDRAGFVSALAAMADIGLSYDAAKTQTFVPPGPWKRRRASRFVHISDTFDLYEHYCRVHNLETGGWPQFRAWADTLDKDPND